MVVREHARWGHQAFSRLSKRTIDLDAVGKQPKLAYRPERLVEALRLRNTIRILEMLHIMVEPW